MIYNSIGRIVLIVWAVTLCYLYTAVFISFSATYFTVVLGLLLIAICYQSVFKFNIFEKIGNFINGI